MVSQASRKNDRRSGLDSHLGVNDAQIDARCADFQAAWEAWRPPEPQPLLETFLDSDDPDEVARLLVELLLLEIAIRQEAGESPRRSEYIARFIEFGSVVAGVFDQLGLMNDAPPTPLEEGDQVASFTIREQLGEGAFGNVFLAEGDQGRVVAIKTPKMSAAEGSTGTLQFLQETQTISELEHPHIISVSEYGVDCGRLYAVMPHIGGGTLKELAEKEKLTQAHAAQLVEQVADAVAYAHNQGVFHRDLTMENILIDSSGAAQVSDFGLAISRDDQRQRAGEFAGSLRYMSPEQVRGDAHRLDGRTDVWALGVILYELLTGRRPFDGEAESQTADEILHREPIPPRQIDSSIDPVLERACLKCLSKSVTDRYATAADLARVLRGYRQRWRRRLSWAGAILGAAGLLAASLFAGAALAPTAFDAPSKPTDNTTLVVKRTSPVEHSVVLEFEEGLVTLGQAGTLPHLIGRQFFFQASLPEAKYVYVIVITPDAEAAPVFPTFNDWHAAANASPQKAIRSANVPLGKPGGGVTVILATRQQPIADAKHLEELIAGVPAALKTKYDLLRYENGVMVVEDTRIARGFGTDVKELDSLEARQAWLNRRFQDLFDDVYITHFRAVADVKPQLAQDSN